MNPLIRVLRRMGGAATRPLLMPLAVLLLMLALARVDWDRLAALLRRPGLAIALSLLNLIAVPLVVWPIWQGLGLWPGLIAALCLSAMAPGIISAATTAAFLRLDASLALLISLITNFLVPFTLPPLALWLLGLDLKIGLLDLSLRLGLIVALALAGAIVIRRVLGPRLKQAGTTLDGISVAVLMVFAIPLMDGVMAFCTLPLLDLRTALTAGYCSGGRHNALLMAVLPVTAEPDIFLFIAAVQFPIYMIPTMLQPIYRRLLRA